MRALLSGMPQLAMPAQIEFSSEQIMLGGRPFRMSPLSSRRCSAWSVRRLEFRAPGTTRVSLTGASAQNASPDHFKAALSVDSADPDALMMWLQGRGDLGYRSQKPLRLRGDVSIASNRFAIDGMKAELKGGAVEGRVAFSPNSRTVARASKPNCGPSGSISTLREPSLVRSRVRRPSGRTRRSSRSISAAPSRRDRNCGRWRRGSATIQKPSSSID